jgi:hypothetical protein
MVKVDAKCPHPTTTICIVLWCGNQNITINANITNQIQNPKTTMINLLTADERR